MSFTRLHPRLLMYSGWLLYFYACTHLINHAIGIFGLDALEKTRKIFIGFWRLPVLEWLVVFALVVHFVCVMIKLFNKKTYKGMAPGEWVQIVLGLMAPDLIVHHIFETKMAHKLFGVTDSYTYYIYWTPDYYTYLFILLIGVLWIHGTIGIRWYVKQKPWYPKWGNWLGGIAVALPILALWGVMNAVNEVERRSQDPQWVAGLEAASNPRQIDLYNWTESWSYYFVGGYLLFLLLFFLARKMSISVRRRKSSIQIRYLEGRSVTVPRGTSLLEASLQANIPHAHVCGGRGRCSTCRVQIIEGLEHLPPASQEEIALLTRVKGTSSVRLACRTRPQSDCTIYPLLLPGVSLHDTLWKKNAYTGTDRNVAILFSDLRGFTSMAEDKLPYDVVFVLNQYFQSMGQAVEAHHGRIDKFIGDAIMAVFGINRTESQACIDALAAAQSMRLQLDRLNAQLRSELSTPLKMGFGVHFGHVIIGEMGYKDSNNFVAIGDATNTASRLESLTKEHDCELVVSHDVIAKAGLNFNNHETRDVEIRGRQKSIHVYCVKDVRDMQLGGLPVAQ